MKELRVGARHVSPGQTAPLDDARPTFNQTIWVIRGQRVPKAARVANERCGPQSLVQHSLP